MDFYIELGILITIVLLGIGIWMSWFFYNNETDPKQALKDQLFIWFNGDLLIKIGLMWVVILLLHSTHSIFHSTILKGLLKLETT